MFDKIHLLKARGYKPDIIFDIGAHIGSWSAQMMNIYNDSNYILYEPIDYVELNVFNNFDNVIKYNELLYDKIEEVKWYELRNTGDSIFKEKTHHFVDCSYVMRKTIDLDSHLLNNKINFEKINNIFIKIDSQGSEIPILRGAKPILDKTDFILLEIPFFGQYNEGVPTFL